MVKYLFNKIDPLSFLPYYVSRENRTIHILSIFFYLRNNTVYAFSSRFLSGLHISSGKKNSFTTIMEK